MIIIMFQLKLRQRECNGTTKLRSLQMLNGRANKRVYFIYEKNLNSGIKRILRGPGFPNTHQVFALRDRQPSFNQSVF